MTTYARRSAMSATQQGIGSLALCYDLEVMRNLKQALISLFPLIQLSLGGCNDETGMSSETDSSSSTSAAQPPETSTPNSTDNSTTAASGGAPTSTSGGEGTSTSGTTSNSTTGSEPQTACDSYAMQFIDCEGLGDEYYADILADCEKRNALLQTLYGDACVSSLEDYYMCFAEASCNAWQECKDENDTFMQTCIPEPGAACLAYQENQVECLGDEEPNQAENCQMAIDIGSETYGTMCGVAYRDYFACLSQLGCDESGCDAELDAIGQFCAG